MLKKITEFTVDNKVLKEINKSSQINLKYLKNSMRDTQKSEKLWKEHYKMLQLKNKHLLTKLQNTKSLIKGIDVEYSKEPQRKKRKLIKENNISSISFLSKEGLLVIFYLFKDVFNCYKRKICHLQIL